MTEAPKKKMSKGCLIGIALLGVAVVILVITIMYGPGMVMDKIKSSAAELETKIISLNPPGYTEEQIQSIFSGVMTAFETGKLSSETLKKTTQTLTEIQSVDSLTVDEALKVLKALETMLPGTKSDITMDEDSTDALEMAPTDSIVDGE